MALVAVARVAKVLAEMEAMEEERWWRRPSARELGTALGREGGGLAGVFGNRDFFARAGLHRAYLRASSAMLRRSILAVWLVQVERRESESQASWGF